MKNEHEILWDSFYESHNDKMGIVEDGALNPAIWVSQSPQILFYYKETYGYGDCEGFSLSTVFEDIINEKKNILPKNGYSFTHHN